MNLYLCEEHREARPCRGCEQVKRAVVKAQLADEFARGFTQQDVIDALRRSLNA